MNPVIFEEVQQAFKEEMPGCADWTALNIYFKLVNMVAKISGRLFVGPELCRNEDYLRLAIEYTMQLINAQLDIKKLRPIFRPWTAPRLESVRKLHQAEKDAHAFLAPIIKSRQDAKKNDPDWQAPDDMLSWTMKRQEATGDSSIERTARMQLGLIFAAIHTTTMTATNM